MHARLPAYSSESYTVRWMTSSDLGFVAQEHLRNFPDGFFARLGLRFLCAYYRSFLGSPHARAFVVTDSGGRPQGYLVGMTAPPQHRELVLREHRLRLAALGGTALVLHPTLLLEFAQRRARRYWKKMWASAKGATDLLPDKKSVAPGSTQRSGVLAHVAVGSAHRCRGLGDALVRRFLEEAISADCDHVLLVTQSGGPAARFYEQRLWTPVNEKVTVDGHKLTTYSYPTTLPECAPSSRLANAGRDRDRASRPEGASSG
ncbi:hypothetical protein GCM10011376_13870 [Nocardioides flavus (ex Wang et al. 2016)]|jgi:ribosomal protein S18 acetylase RimI-like enzyme|uniref:N-acetyltransferase domain-containing protein n=2 Tax=Nocardioides flavus (ex Wang et al. 2016) TaxID=2058780 RepID=A0ABQ3HJC8_9ACTN|nr:hypothetical protein GCM10011376_13870 [Nocardioides flavus (ex Wang et al. 2016)]